MIQTLGLNLAGGQAMTLDYGVILKTATRVEVD
jgi:hypothetical protein